MKKSSQIHALLQEYQHRLNKHQNAAHLHPPVVAKLLSLQPTAGVYDVDMQRALADSCMELPNWRVSGPYAEEVALHRQILRHCFQKEPQQAYTLQLQLIQLQQAKLQRHTMPILFQMLADGRRLAQWADRVETAKRAETQTQDAESGTAEPCQRFREEFTRLVIRLYTSCLHDRSPIDQSKKWGVYYLMGLLYRCIFELKTLNLAKNSLVALNNADLPNIEMYPKAHIVTFLYYTGWFYFWNEDYTKAMENWEQALLHLPATGAEKQRQQLWDALLPCALLNGRLPTHVPESNPFSHIISDWKQGNLRGWNEWMDKYEHYWVVKGQFLVVERLTTYVWRNYLRRIFLILDQNTRIPLEIVLKGVHWMGMTKMDLDGVECVICNLIYKGLVKGYVSHEKRILVLSKGNAFPPIAQVVENQGLVM